MTAASQCVNDHVAALSRNWIGTPFVHQASVRGVGCDCLGLLRGLWREAIGPEPLPVPPYAPGWPGTVAGGEEMIAALARVFRRAPSRLAQPGQVLVFRIHRALPAGHIAILAAPGRLVHARDPLGVIEEALTDAWARRLVVGFAWPESEEAF